MLYIVFRIQAKSTMNRILKIQERLLKFPFGRRIFSYVVASNAPYFHSIKPRIIELKHNYLKASMPKRRAVHNHLKTVHAIAMCNLCEFVGGICMEVSIPKHRRWIPVGMTVAYLKKATTDLTAECDLSEVDWDHCTEVHCMIEVKDNTGLVVMTADITMKVSNKKKK